MTFLWLNQAIDKENVVLLRELVNGDNICRVVPRTGGCTIQFANGESCDYQESVETVFAALMRL